MARALPELDATASIAQAPALSPRQERGRIFEAFVALFSQWAWESPQLLTPEELLGADETSLGLLRLLPRRLASVRPLLVTTARRTSRQPAQLVNSACRPYMPRVCETSPPW